jgi:anhydro-N-acetylmuramic acid kinase
VPLFHESALTEPGETRIILNLGGIANISVLSGSDAPVLGFDTGPASTLLDAWCLKHRGTPFDVDGQWAAHGQCQDDLLAVLMDEPFLQRPPPKSTGRELFSLAWLEHKIAMLHVINPAPTELAESARASQNVQATLSRFSALSIAQACLKALATPPRFSQAETRVQVYACGGGVRNLQLMKDIKSALAAQARLFNWAGHISLQDTSSLGLEPQHVEASAFAWLAAQRWWQRPLSLHQTTGSRRPHVAGALYLP